MHAETEHHAREDARDGSTEDHANKHANQDGAHSLPKDMVHDVSAIRAESQPDADFAYGSADAVRHHGIHANRGEQQRQCTQATRQSNNYARGATPDFKIVFEPCDIDRDIRVKRLRRIADAVGDIGEACHMANQQIGPGVVLRPGGKIKVARIKLSKVRNLSILGHPDDYIFAASGSPQCFAQRIFAGPEPSRSGL